MRGYSYVGYIRHTQTQEYIGLYRRGKIIYMFECEKETYKPIKKLDTTIKNFAELCDFLNKDKAYRCFQTIWQ